MTTPIRSFKKSFFAVCVYTLSMVLGSINAQAQTCAQIQTPTKCFEIVGIMADACGTDEQANEMVLIKTGAGFLNVNNISVTWPDPANIWQGFVRDTSTQKKVDAINSSITKCGRVFQIPTNGIVPPTSLVMIIGDTSFSPNTYDFSELRDSLYLMFQAPGNTVENFPNHTFTPSPNPELIISFSPVCADTVEYQLNRLTRSNGSVGPQDGALVEFSFNGFASYKNFGGCKALYTDLSVNAGTGGSVCKGQQISLSGTASQGTCTRWLTTPGASGFFANPNLLSTQYTASANDAATIRLVLRSESKCETIFDTVTIDVKDPPVVNITSLPGDLCIPNNFNLVATSGPPSNPPTVAWTTNGQGSFTNTNTLTTEYIPGANESGPVNLTITATNSCGAVSTTITINVFSPPTADAGNDDTLCVGQNINLQGTGTLGGSTISWTTDGAGSFNDPAVINPTYTPDPGDNGIIKFFLDISNPCGTALDTVEILLQSPPDSTFTGLGGPYCEGDPPVTLTPATAGGSFSGNGVSGNAFDPASAGTGTHTITYTVTVNGCTTTSSQTVTVIPGPVADFSFSPTNPEIGETINFTFTGSGNPANFSWTFGDANNSTSSQQDPTFSYNTGGTYKVTLEVSSGNCTDTISKFVTLQAPEMFDIGNAFTPDNDGINDVFTVVADGFTAYKITIFNRWGDVLFESTDPTDHWDGTFNGAMSPEGTYFYIVTGTGKSGTNYERNGTVTLLRK